MEGVGGMKASVIMLTYNRQELVGRAIESILCQTLTDFEFIIINNGSSDNSGKIAEEYAKKDSRIRVIHKARGNIGSGRNAGLEAAAGDYIAFIDDDDWAQPDFLEFLYSLASLNNADVAICGAADKHFDEKLIMTPQQALIELMWRKRYNMAFPTKLFSKKLIKHIHFPENDKFDDISQMYRLLAFADKTAYHGIAKYTFYRHESNNSSWTTNHSLITADTLEEYLAAYASRTKWLSEKFAENAADWQYFEWSFMISMVEKINRLNLPGCEKQLCQMTSALSLNKAAFLSSPHILPFEAEWAEKFIQ